MPSDLPTQFHALERQRQQAMTLFTEAPVPYLLLNSQNQIESINIRGCALLQGVPEELLGRPLISLLTSETQAEAHRALEQALETQTPQRVAAQLTRGEAPSLAVVLDLVAFEDTGEPSRCRVVITEVLNTEATSPPMLPPQDGDPELETVVIALIQQLHLPLARALNFLALVRRSMSAQVPRAVEQVEHALQGLVNLVASMERYMQVRQLYGRGHLRHVNLQQVWREVLQDAQPLMADRVISITSDPLPTLQGDSQALVVILGEYLSNALKFTKTRPEAQLHLRVHETATDYHLGLEDNGVGFNIQHQSRLFQVFGRLHPSRVYEGSGVGLASVRRIAQQFGGQVWAEGTVGGGATFWLSWPKQPPSQAKNTST
jgi:signal transduction histidine kinase